jgi:spermidine synthase
MVCEVSKKYLPTIASALDNPKVKHFYRDGFQFLKEHTNEYDAIITDSSDPIGMLLHSHFISYFLHAFIPFSSAR